MNTVQSNREEASFSSQSSLVGQTPPPTANNQADQPEAPAYIPAYRNEKVSINKSLLDKHIEIVSNLDDLLGSTVSPVAAIHRLLLHWLPKADLSYPSAYDLRQIESLFELIDFLFVARQDLKELDFCESEVAKMEAGEGKQGE